MTDKIKFWAWVLLIFLVLWAADYSMLSMPPLPQPTVAAGQCRQMKFNQQRITSMNISLGGDFCIDDDYERTGTSITGHSSPPPWAPIIELHNGGITLDLHGRTIVSKWPTIGIAYYPASNQAEAARRGWRWTPKGNRIANGYLDLRDGNVGIEFVDDGGTDLPIDAKPERAPTYTRPGHVLENLVIRSTWLAVLLEGRGNIIRNCIIESEGDAAIIVAGPGSIIENNTVVLHHPLIPTDPGLGIFDWDKILASRQRMHAAIVLRDASGSRVVGNKIVVKDASDTRHALYIGDQSKDVVLEGNRILGPTTLAKTDPDVTFVDRWNTVEPHYIVH